MKAWELLSDKSKWIKYDFARDAEGNGGLYGYEPEAVCWCALGAIQKCYHKYDERLYATRKIQAVAVRKYGVLNVSEVNDQLGYDAVLAVLKEADV